MPEFILLAGDALSDSIHYHEFNPFMTVKGGRVGDNNSYIYHDSALIDVNNQNNSSLRFELFPVINTALHHHYKEIINQLRNHFQWS